MLKYPLLLHEKHVKNNPLAVSEALHSKHSVT